MAETELSLIIAYLEKRAFRSGNEVRALLNTRDRHEGERHAKAAVLLIDTQTALAIKSELIAGAHREESDVMVDLPPTAPEHPWLRKRLARVLTKEMAAIADAMSENGELSDVDVRRLGRAVTRARELLTRRFVCLRLRGLDEDGHEMEMDVETAEAARDVFRHWRITGGSHFTLHSVYIRPKRARSGKAGKKR